MVLWCCGRTPYSGDFIEKQFEEIFQCNVNNWINSLCNLIGFWVLLHLHIANSKIFIIITNMQMKCEHWPIVTLLFGRRMMQISSTKMFPPHWRQYHFFAFDNIGNDASIARNQQNCCNHLDSIFHDIAAVIRFVPVHLVNVFTLFFEWRYWCQGSRWCELYTVWCISMSKSRSSNKVYDDYINV